MHQAAIRHRGSPARTIAVVLGLLACLLVPAARHPVEAAAAGPAMPSFDTVFLDPDGPQFTGDPITLALKDADIKDVLRTFAEMTGLNIVVHPAVHGTVTVELRNVPWDQALDIILRINGLAWELEGNILYVAPPEHLGPG
jgi:type II secretory pathway component GspD/PulD (secretin)